VIDVTVVNLKPVSLWTVKAPGLLGENHFYMQNRKHVIAFL